MNPESLASSTEGSNPSSSGSAPEGRRPRWLATLALFLALAGVGGALFQDDLRAVFRPELQEQIEEERREQEETASFFTTRRPVHPGDPVRLTFSGLGFGALCLGVGALLRREDPRVATLALAVSLVPLAWQYLGIVLIILVGLVILGVFLGILG